MRPSPLIGPIDWPTFGLGNGLGNGVRNHWASQFPLNDGQTMVPGTFVPLAPLFPWHLCSPTFVPPPLFPLAPLFPPLFPLAPLFPLVSKPQIFRQHGKEGIAVHDCDRSPMDSKPENSMRYRPLVSLSLFLVVLLEVAPTEADFLATSIPAGRVWFGLAIKSLCLTLILVPLIVYLAMNGRKGLRSARGRIITVCAIIVVRAIIDVLTYVPLR